VYWFESWQIIGIETNEIISYSTFIKGQNFVSYMYIVQNNNYNILIAETITITSLG